MTTKPVSVALAPVPQAQDAATNNRENVPPTDPNLSQSLEGSGSASSLGASEGSGSSPLLQPKRPEGPAKESLRERLRLRETRRQQQAAEKATAEQVAMASSGEGGGAADGAGQGGAEQKNPMISTAAMG